MSDLFQQLSAMRTTRIPVALQPAAEVIDPATGQPTLITLPNSEPITFEIQQISADELMHADSIMDAAIPPRLTHDEARIGTVGTVKVDDGPNWDDPGYISQRQKLLLKRNALICIYGCPMLKDSTPGDTPEKQADELTRCIGALVLAWLTDKLEKMNMFTGVGEAEVALFLADRSGGAASSSGSRAVKTPGKKTRSSKGSTARRSTTKSAKRRGSGR